MRKWKDRWKIAGGLARQKLSRTTSTRGSPIVKKKSEKDQKKRSSSAVKKKKSQLQQEEARTTVRQMVEKMEALG